MRKLLARFAVGAVLALLVGSPRTASSGIVERLTIAIRYLAYEPNDEVSGTCYYECTVEVTTIERVREPDGSWGPVETVTYDGEPVSKPGNASGGDCELAEFMPKLSECPTPGYP